VAKKPELPKPTTWTISAKQERLGVVEVLDEATAIEKAAAEFKVPINTVFCWSEISQRKDPALIRGAGLRSQQVGLSISTFLFSSNAWQCAGFPKSGTHTEPNHNQRV
jgi:hypothetical protein